MSSRLFPRTFRFLAWANLAAQSAEQLSLSAVPLVAVLVLGAGPGDIGALAAAQTLPFLLLSIPFGLAADRLSKRRLMVAAEALRALSLVGLLAALLWGRLSLGWLGALGFLGAVGTVAFSVAAPALVPVLVPRDALAQANGRLELARSVAFTAGPALAGALVSWAGASAAFALAAMLSVMAAGLLMRLPESVPATPPMGASATSVGAAPASANPATLRRHPWSELKDGARLVWRHPLLRPMLLTAAFWNLSWFVLQAAYVSYAVRALGLGADGVGLTLAANGAGMVAGALLAPRVVAALPFGRAVQLGPAVSVLAATLMVATLAWPSGALAAASFFLFGAGPIVWVITSATLRQSVTPDGMLGRVSALFLVVNAGVRPVGAALGGLIGVYWGEAGCLWVALVGFGVQAGLIFGSGALRGLVGLPERVG